MVQLYLAFVPFARNEATRHNSPTKAPEFLATGLPVIFSPVAGVICCCGQPEVMDWCEANGACYLLGLTGNAVLRHDTALTIAADDWAVRRAVKDLPDMRCHDKTRYATTRWKRARRVVAHIEARRAGMDIRYLVTSPTKPIAEQIYEAHYCQSRQAENLIKMHKGQVASDRTSCRSANANPAHGGILADVDDPLGDAQGDQASES